MNNRGGLRWDRIKVGLKARLSVNQYADFIAPTRQLEEKGRTTVVAARQSPSFMDEKFHAIIRKVTDELGETAVIIWRGEL